MNIPKSDKIILDCGVGLINLGYKKTGIKLLKNFKENTVALLWNSIATGQGFTSRISQDLSEFEKESLGIYKQTIQNLVQENDNFKNFEKLIGELTELDKNLTYRILELPEFNGDISDVYIGGLQEFIKLLKKGSIESHLKFFKKRYSLFNPFLQAFLWYCSFLSESNLIYETRSSALDFYKRVWLFSYTHCPDQWSKYNIVIKRLVDPLSISLFIQMHISYELYGGKAQSSMEIFYNKKANCSDMAYFALECLRKSGKNYDPKILVIFNQAKSSGHAVCIFSWNNGIFLLNNGYLQGPFSDYETAAQAAGYGPDDIGSYEIITIEEFRNRSF